MDVNSPQLSQTLNRAIYGQPTTDTNPLNELLGLFTPLQVDKKHILVHANEQWKQVYFIQRGLIRVYYLHKDGREYNKGFFQEGQLMWPIAPYARQQHCLFTIESLEPTEIWQCDFRHFQHWLKIRQLWPQFALPYAEQFAEEKCMREYSFLMKSATDRYLEFCSQHPKLLTRIPDYHLASYLGITPISLSRLKKDLIIST